MSCSLHATLVTADCRRHNGLSLCQRAAHRPVDYNILKTANLPSSTHDRLALFLCQHNVCLQPFMFCLVLSFFLFFFLCFSAPTLYSARRPRDARQKVYQIVGHTRNIHLDISPPPHPTFYRGGSKSAKYSLEAQSSSGVAQYRYRWGIGLA